MVYWLRKSPCFEFFGYGKYGLFWAKKLVEIWYLLITETFLLWTFRGVGNTVFLWDKNLMEIWYLRITEKFLFWNFLWWEIFTWSFSAFHDLRNTVFRAAFLLTLSPTIYFQPKITHIVRDKDLVLFNGDKDCDKVS